MKVNIWQKLKFNKLNKKSIIIIAVLVFSGLSLAAPASANWATDVVGGLLGLIVSAVGLILILAIKTLILIAQYSTFLDSGAVTFGWVIVRDLCNMFFVIVLLIIAFGTILNLEKYNYKKWLPKLILMAVLINFSKTICGVLIDVAQVVMLTFVNSFSTIGSGSLINALGITDILQMAKDSDVSGWTVIGAYVLALAYVIISSIVIITMIAMLAIRIVMIWIYVVLSPLAYLLSAFPGGQSYASKWWSDFTKNLIVGPVLAFFLWLSFAALTADQLKYDTSQDDATAKEQAALTGSDPNAVSPMGTKASSPSALIKFVIAIGMLVGGLKIAQEVGGAAGSMAGKGMAAVNKAGKIGLAGATAVTGVRAVQGVYKNYSSARKSAREDKYKNTAVDMAGKIGKVKHSVGGGVSSALQWSKNQTIDRLGGGYKAKNLETKARQERVELDMMQQNLDQKNSPVVGKNAKGEKKEYNYDAGTEEWKDESGAKVKEEDIQSVINDKKVSVNTNQERADKLNSRQQKVDKVLKTGALATGGAASFALGGLPGLALAGGYGIKSLIEGHKLKDSGKTDLDVGSGFRLKEIKKEKEDLKDEDDGSVIAKMDDRGSSAFERAAAALEAMERGLLSSEQAQSKRKMISKEVGGTDKDGNFKDKKVGSYFESMAQRKNISASRDFQDLKSKQKDGKPNTEVRQRAEKNIRAKVENGTYNLDSLDIGAIEAIGPQLIALMKAKDFGTQFSAMKDQGKKRKVVEVLKSEATQDTSKLSPGIEKNNAEAAKLGAMKKLNQVTDLNTATASISNPAERQKAKKEIVKDAGAKELQDIFSGNNKDQQKAFKDLVTELKKIPLKQEEKDAGMTVNDVIIKNFPAASNMLNNGSSAADSLQVAMGIKEKKPSGSTSSQSTGPVGGFAGKP